MSLLKSVRNAIRPVVKTAYYTGSGRWCTVCERAARKFRPFGTVAGVEMRPDAMCPWCRSLERHRLVVTYFRNNTDLFDGRPKRLLHIAPEARIEALFRDAVKEGYLSGDLFDEGAMEKMDITDIQHPDDSFDVIYCSHVLEHVPDDRRAMREFHRVLKPNGWAVLNVPVEAEETIEDPSIEDPRERERLFGQSDHVRCYGPDYADRLREAGFGVEVIHKTDVFTDAEVVTNGLTNRRTGDIYYCTK